MLSSAGKHFGTIIAPKHIHNMAWGDEDNKTLYLCARSGLYCMRLNIPGSHASMPKNSDPISKRWLILKLSSQQKAPK